MNDPLNTCETEETGSLSESCAVCNVSLGHLNPTDDYKKEYETNKFCICKICYRIFTRVEDLIVHVGIHSDISLKENRIACKSCTKKGNKYTTKSQPIYDSQPGAVMSTSSHALPKSNTECKFCQKIFIGKYELYKHRRDHFDRVVHRCDRCNKEFIGEKR